MENHNLALKAISAEISNIELQLFDYEKIQDLEIGMETIEILKKDIKNLEFSLEVLVSLQKNFSPFEQSSFGTK